MITVEVRLSHDQARALSGLLDGITKVVEYRDRTFHQVR